MEDDWGLLAVVRGRSATAAATNTTTFSSSATTPTWSFENSYQRFQEKDFLGVFPDLCEPRRENSLEGMFQHLYKPTSSPNAKKDPVVSESVPISPVSVLGGLK